MKIWIKKTLVSEGWEGDPSQQANKCSIPRSVKELIQHSRRRDKLKRQMQGNRAGGWSLRSSIFVDLTGKPLIFTCDRYRPRIRGIGGENVGNPLAITKVSGPHVITGLSNTFNSGVWVRCYLRLSSMKCTRHHGLNMWSLRFIEGLKSWIFHDPTPL